MENPEGKLYPQIEHLFDPENSLTTCQYCNTTGTPTVKYTATKHTHYWAILYIVFCCCCLPYLLRYTKNKDYHCSNCDKYLGTYVLKEESPSNCSPTLRH